MKLWENRQENGKIRVGGNMYRSALCLEMLKILNQRDLVTIETLAEKLETNPRNIPIFKKELEMAGYVIETVRGRYGGYRLSQKALLPVPKLTQQQHDALSSAVEYLAHQPDFLDLKEFEKAIEAIQSAVAFQKENDKIVFRNEKNERIDEMRHAIEICHKAIKESHCISFEYKSIHADSFQTVILHPYEVLNIQSQYYCLGYNRDKLSYRIYKFSELRMQKVKILESTFIRDTQFNVNQYIGKSGLMKDEGIELECIIDGDYSVYLYEKGIGVHSKMSWMDDKKLHVITFIEGKQAAMQFLGSLGSHVNIIKPLTLKEEMKQEVIKMLENYK